MKWSYEEIQGNRAFLVSPGSLRVAEMTLARAKGIAAALNTPEGAKAFEENRLG